MNTPNLNIKELKEFYPKLVIEQYFPHLTLNKSEMDNGYILANPTFDENTFKTSYRFNLSEMSDENIIDFLNLEYLPEEMEAVFMGKTYKFDSLKDRISFAKGFETKYNSFMLVECDDNTHTQTQHRLTVRL